jgi:hypothetical protein
LKRGKTEIVQEWLHSGLVDPSYKDNDAIKSTAEYGYLTILNILLSDSRVNPAANFDKALENACSRGKLEAVKCLLEDPRVGV